MLRPALNHESDAISALMRQSKAHWGYSIEQIEEWRDELTMTVDYIENNHVCLAVKSAEICGMCGFKTISADKIRLDCLFVAPSQIGLGVGSALLKYCINTASKSSASTIVLDADPNAEGFYLCHGFKVIDHKASSIKGRFLPVMSMTLEDHVK